jgi:hypothetical protein
MEHNGVRCVPSLVILAAASSIRRLSAVLQRSSHDSWTVISALHVIPHMLACACWMVLPLSVPRACASGGHSASRRVEPRTHTDATACCMRD